MLRVLTSAAAAAAAAAAAMHLVPAVRLAVAAVRPVTYAHSALRFAPAAAAAAAAAATAGGAA
jgi:hypothetical protein